MIVGMCQLPGAMAGSVPRWRIDGQPIIIGGPVSGEADWAELRGYGVTHCCSATSPDDEGVPDQLRLQFHVDDDGKSFPEERLEQVTRFASRCFAEGGTLYLHCWVGASRSPSFAYAVLRTVRGLGPAEAKAAIQASYPYQPTFGIDPKHQNYIAGIEAWIAKRAKPRRYLLLFGPYCLSTRGGFDFTDHEGDVRGRTGSEHGFIRMGEELQKLGHHVALGTLPYSGSFPPTWRDLQLVDYADRKDEEWDVAISWNEAEPLRGVRATASAVSLQINTVVGDLSGIEVDAWLSPSEPHRQRLQHHGGRWEVVPDGVDLGPLDALAKAERKVPGRVVWTSSPDRGLHWLLSVWPDVRRAVPWASLKVFYEYKSWLAHMKRVPPQYTAPDMLEQIRRAAYIEAAISALSRMGVEFCGATPRRDVERELVRAECLAYSCDTVLWSEGYSCSMMEACAARSCPVATDCDAFPDIYGGVLPLVPLPLSRSSEQFAGTVVAALTDRNFRDGVNQRARALAEKNTWAAAAERMSSVMESVLQGK